jgi:hypothetical protein
VKRSRQIGLVLLGGASLGALPACAPGPVVKEPAVSTDLVYANDHFIPGVGYYHAPFRAFFPRRYNEVDPLSKLYFYAGNWHATPHQSIINVSSPTPAAVEFAQRARTDIPRGGFGSFSNYHGGGGFS